MRKEALSHTVGEQNPFWKATLEIFIKMWYVRTPRPTNSTSQSYPTEILTRAPKRMPKRYSVLYKMVKKKETENNLNKKGVK